MRKYSKFIKYYCEECKKEISYRSARNGAKRCRECYLKNPDKDYSHNFTKSELKKRSIKMKKIGKKYGGLNKGKSTWLENPESVLKGIQTQINHKLITKGSFKKGHTMSIKGVGSRKNLIHEHHIDLNQIDSRPINVLYLSSSVHGSLHKKAYDYLVKSGLIKQYIRWFIKEFKPKIYNKEQHEKQVLWRTKNVN